MRTPRRGAGADAETGRGLAVAALNFLAADPSRLSRFLALTGLGPHNLREAARDPGFFAAVLDHVLADEPMLAAFASEAGVAPETVNAAREALGRPSGRDSRSESS